MADTPPEIGKTPEKCPICDVTLTLGLLTSACENARDPALKGKCLEVIKPLEQGKGNAVDALTEAIVILGEDNVNETVERFNMLMMDATDRAKRKLIEKGVLNADGTPKEPKL